MDQCSFVHPGEPGWDIQPGPAGRSFTSRKQDKDNWGSGGSGWGDGPSSGWGEPSKSGQVNSSWNEAEVTGWGNANSSTMKIGDQSKSDRPSATSGWANAGATDGWGNAGATEGWGNARATEGWGNAGATEGWGDAGTGGSTWGEPWDKSSNDAKGASEGGVWEKGEWGAPAAEAPKPTIPAKRELPRAEEPFKDSHWEPPKPVPAISHLHSDKEDEIAVPTAGKHPIVILYISAHLKVSAASDEPEDLLDDGLKGLDITTSSSGLTKMFTL